MKLIDILIERGIQWPEGATGAVQDRDGEVKFYAGGKPRLNNGVWIRDKGVDTVYICYIQIASDYNTAIITKQEWENSKMSKMSKAMFADVQVGDYVWDSRKGWGNVGEVVHSSHFPIRVDFGHDSDAYTLDGYYSIDDVHPSLFWDEIELKAPPAPMPHLELDTEVFVWKDDGLKVRRHFSHFSEDGVLHVFDGGLTSFTGSGNTTAWDYWGIAKYA